MQLPIATVDAFARAPFEGNPAAVCLLPHWLDDAVLSRIAAELNLSETAFLVRNDDGSHRLRWLTPAVEVDLCGHATLASAHRLWELGVLAATERARFHTRSGELTATRLSDGRIELDFPATPAHDEPAPEGLASALGVSAIRTAKKSPFDWLVEVEDEREVREARPDMRALSSLPVRGVILTARASTPGLDIVSRFFGPGAGVDEDPVTGSAHCALTPYWAERLGRTTLAAYQASRRGGHLECELVGARVRLRGTAVTVLTGTLSLP